MADFAAVCGHNAATISYLLESLFGHSDAFLMLQGRPLVERLKGGIGHFLGIGESRWPQQEQLVGAKLQGEAREALIAALAVGHWDPY